MHESTMLDDAVSRWTEWPTAKQRTGVRHALARLLDDLAPVGAPPRGAPRPVGPVRHHRSPTGCILQADASAVSVSWFPAADTISEFGELVVLVWSGVVSRPGATLGERGGAVVLAELSLRPVEVGPDVWGWRGTDETLYDGAELATRCRGLLERQPARTA